SCSSLNTRIVTASPLREASRETVARFPGRGAVRTVDDAVSFTWAELARRVDALAGGLARLNVRRGDTIALMLGNRPEFALVDLAAVTLGATPFSIYPTFTPEQIAYVVGDAGARVAVVETAFLKPFLAATANLPALQHVIVVDGDGGTHTLAEVEGPNQGFDAETAWRAVTPNDVLTVIYTFGTTGPPNGVQLTHRHV